MILSLVLGLTFSEAFQSTTSLLFWWYLVLTCIIAFILLFVILDTIIIGTGAEFNNRNVLEAILGILIDDGDGLITTAKLFLLDL